MRKLYKMIRTVGQSLVSFGEPRMQRLTRKEQLSMLFVDVYDIEQDITNLQEKVGDLSFLLKVRDAAALADRVEQLEKANQAAPAAPVTTDSYW